MISAVVLARNEAANLPRCLGSLALCDRILVIDDFSTDETGKIAAAFGARVVKRALDNDFSAQRNFGLSLVDTPWALFTDADEEVSPELAGEIKAVIKKSDVAGYRICRQDYLWGKRIRHGDPGSASFVRLAMVSAGTWNGKVHETWDIVGKTGKLSHPLTHYPHQTVEEFLAHVNQFSSVRAEELRQNGTRGTMLKVIFLPFLKFVRNYVVKAGWLDGMPGLISAMVMAMHTFLTQGKLYLDQKE